MSLDVFWRLPTDGDGRSLSPQLWNRGDYSPTRKQPHAYARTGAPRDGYTFYDHLSQIAGAADLARFDGLWIPHSAAGEEPLIVAGAFAREARHLKLIPSLRAPLLSAVYSAKIANSFQRLTSGRLAWNLIAVDDGENAWHGRRWSVAEQIERTGEFLDVARGFWESAPFTYHGKYFEVENGGFAPALQGPRFPLVYLSGESDEALELGARHADVYVLSLGPVAGVKEKIARLTALAAAKGRTLRFAIEADVVTRHTNEDAWSDLRVRWEEAVEKRVVPFSAAQSNAVPGFDGLRVDDVLWNGFAQVRPGAPAGLVGSYEAVSNRIGEYYAAGVDSFILGANPGLEEALRIGEKILPRIRAIAAATSRQAA